MARSSKSHPFTIYQDTGIPTPDSSYQPSFDDVLRAREQKACDDGRGSGSAGWDEEADVKSLEHDDNEVYDGTEADDEYRRESGCTRTSVSSLPESTWQTDNERETRKPYTPQVIRPSFRRPESVRRMQMTSPPPFSSRSPRQSILRSSRSRTGTPQSVRSSAQAKGSPRLRRRISEETEQHEEQETKHYPLVLLHVTLLPATLPWSSESMQELLPESVLESLQFLRSKMTDTIMQRGLLLSHPREEYELLEERLLEALELREERITKCGHFHRPRNSTSSVSTADGSDSGLGSSVEGLSSDGDICTTCRHHTQASMSNVGIGGRRWSIKVYAANGLMRAGAWAAAWSEMESVDVEVLPWIGEDRRRKLDARRDEETVAERQRAEEEEERFKAALDEQLRLQHEPTRLAEEVEERRDHERESQEHGQIQPPVATSDPTTNTLMLASPAKAKSAVADLPPIYRPSQIPLSVLLRNYLVLLLQDRRNVAILALGVLLLLIGIRSTASAGILNASVPPKGPSADHQSPLILVPATESNVTAAMFELPTMAVANESVTESASPVTEVEARPIAVFSQSTDEDDIAQEHEPVSETTAGDQQDGASETDIATELPIASVIEHMVQATVDTNDAEQEEAKTDGVLAEKSEHVMEAAVDDRKDEALETETVTELPIATVIEHVVHEALETHIADLQEEPQIDVVEAHMEMIEAMDS